MTLKYSRIIAFCAIIISSLLIGCREIAILAKNTQRIDLYGKVVDQYDQPIADVQVKGGILLAVSPLSSDEKEVITDTDVAGKFQFVGLHGMDFGVTLQKTGYEFRSEKGWTKDYQPDPNNPMVFTMWKLQGAEPMVHTKFDSRVPYDGTSAIFNLLTGKKSAAGDLRITLVRNPVQIVRGGAPFDWDVKIEIVGGGLIESHDLYPYEAPENGYQGTLEFSESKDDSHWTQKLFKTFYIHTSNSDYGRVVINLVADSDRPDGAGLTIEAYVNPSGSRNLEWDRTQQVKPPAP